MERIGAAEFSILTWDESTVSEIATGIKITKAKISASYQGDIEGKSVTETLMTYSPNGDAQFMGIEHLTGKIFGKKGSCVLHHFGSYSDGVARSVWNLVESASTDGLVGVSCSGSYSAGRDGKALVTFTLS